MTVSYATKSDENRPSGRVTPWMWIRAVFVIAFVPALALFLPAWTLNWPMAWVYVAMSITFFAGSRAIVACVHPDTLAERGKMLDHADAKQWDRALSPLVGLLGPLATYILAGLVHRFGWGANVPLWAQLAALGVYVVCYVIGSWALVANRFFSGVVRIQTERGHTVVSSGPYAVVRHPGYSSAAISYLALPILLGAYWAIVPAVVTIVLLVVRTALEDRTLRAELPGYEEYTQKTRYRLIPGIW
jgi:protein-S-isoprenylcysteine O-methyltransferase Ste14